MKKLNCHEMLVFVGTIREEKRREEKRREEKRREEKRQWTMSL